MKKTRFAALAAAMALAVSASACGNGSESGSGVTTAPQTTTTTAEQTTTTTTPEQTTTTTTPEQTTTTTTPEQTTTTTTPEQTTTTTTPEQTTTTTTPEQTTTTTTPEQTTTTTTPEQTTTTKSLEELIAEITVTTTEYITPVQSEKIEYIYDEDGLKHAENVKVRKLTITDMTDAQLKENNKILADLNKKYETGITDTYDLVQEINQQLYEYNFAVNHNFGYFKGDENITLMKNVVLSFISGDSVKNNVNSLSTKELQDHLRYCIIYGFKHLYDYDKQTPDIYQIFLSYAGTDNNGGYISYGPGWDVKNVTIKEESKKIGDFTSQLTATVTLSTNSGDDVTNIYLGFFETNGKYAYKIIDLA